MAEIRAPMMVFVVAVCMASFGAGEPSPPVAPVPGASAASYTPLNLLREESDLVCFLTVLRIFGQSRSDVATLELRRASERPRLMKLAVALKDCRINSLVVDRCSAETLTGSGSPAVLEMTWQGKTRLAVYLPGRAGEGLLYCPPEPPRPFDASAMAGQWKGMALFPYMGNMPDGVYHSYIWYRARKAAVAILVTLLSILLVALGLGFRRRRWAKGKTT